MTQNKEDHIAELAKISGMSFDITKKILMTEIAIIQRDLRTRGEAQTFLGRVKITDGKLELVHPSHQIQQMTDRSSLVLRLLGELSSDP